MYGSKELRSLGRLSITAHDGSHTIYYAEIAVKCNPPGPETLVTAVAIPPRPAIRISSTPPPHVGPVCCASAHPATFSRKNLRTKHAHAHAQCASTDGPPKRPASTCLPACLPVSVVSNNSRQNDCNAVHPTSGLARLGRCVDPAGAYAQPSGQRRRGRRRERVRRRQPLGVRDGERTGHVLGSRRVQPARGCR